MSNGKTYTEVLLDVYDKIDDVEQRLIKRMDDVVKTGSECKEALARGDARLIAMDDKINKTYTNVDKRIDGNADSIKNVRNINTFIAVLGSTIAGIIGTQK